MLNISSNRIREKISIDKYKTLALVEKKVSSKVLSRLLIICSVIFFLVLFLPWTQNVRSKGSVTTLKPNQKPQNVNAIIAGKIDKWYVQEGEQVKAGDTIVKLSEIKDDYLNPKLLENTDIQLKLNENKVQSYKEKITALNNQLRAMKSQRDLKLQQTKIKIQQNELKVQNDSATYSAAQANFNTAIAQYNRQDSLYKIGLKSLTDLEKRNLKMQETNAYAMSARNKWLNAKNELINLQVELSNIKMKYESDAAKTQSEIFTTLSSQLETESSVNKLVNTYSNYSIRNDMYYILAPQDGYITQTFYSGIGETVKQGSSIASIMPDNYQLATDLYIDPIDLPLMKIGQNVQIQFDGWPAIVFSGWPNASYGTYQGKIYAIDQFVNKNGKYRVLVMEDSTNYPWPKELRFGSATSNMILLKNVPIWYELWRQINGFPPDYYKSDYTRKQVPKGSKNK